MAATSALSGAERSYPTSKVRDRSREDPMPRGGGQKELPHVQGKGQRPRVPGCDGAGTPRGATPCPRLGAAAEKSYPTSEARGSGREDLPHS